MVSPRPKQWVAKGGRVQAPLGDELHQLGDRGRVDEARRHGDVTSSAAAVLDASALLALLHQEPGAEVVVDVMADGAAISVVNLAELLSKLADAGKDPGQANRELRGAQGDVAALIVEPLTEHDCVEVARLRSKTPDLGLSLAADAELGDAANVLAWDLGYLTDRFPQTTEAIRDGSRRGDGHEVWWR